MRKTGYLKTGLGLLSCLTMLSACGDPDIIETIGSGDRGFAEPSASRCLKTLKSQDVEFEVLANKYYGGGCKAVDAVKLLDFGTKATNLGPMTCSLASSFTNWSTTIVAPAARKYLGSPLARIETSGTYSCRRVNGSGNLSQHAHANAVDVYAFVTEDGQKVTVLGGWNGSQKQQAFLRHLHSASCGPFRTVLGPNYDAQHRNHFHFDMAPSRVGKGKAFCR